MMFVIVLFIIALIQGTFVTMITMNGGRGVKVAGIVIFSVLVVMSLLLVVIVATV